MILTTIYSMGEPLMGMPTIEENGFCTADEGQLTALRSYENESLTLDRVSRRSGVLAKSMTGAAIRTEKIRDEGIGTFDNCIQMGRTRFEPFAPRQPLGRAQGKRVIRFSRTWLHLGA